MSRLRAEELAGELFRSKEALEISEGRVRRIIDANIIGVLFAKFDGSVYEANGAFLKMVGYSKKELQEGVINFLKITPPEQRKFDLRAIREMRQKGSHKPFEKEFIRKDGSRVPVLVGTAYLKGSKNEGIWLIVDLTERKQLERQKDEFISIASHELKTPVTSLKAYAQVLTKRMTKKGDTDSASHLIKMDNQLDKLTNLIKDLLDVTKIEGGKLQFQNDYFDMNELVREIVEEVQRTTERHAIQITGILTKKLYGDRERIGQVLINLLSNAIKYSPNAEKVTVSLQEGTDTTTICVRDYGVGIPKNMQAKVFDRFFRVNDTRSQTFPGLGLGLYISAEIIKRQKGKIWIESEPGKGSEFCFSLPVEGSQKVATKSTKNTTFS
jgi:PAS domain S-box-containing protein